MVKCLISTKSWNSWNSWKTLKLCDFEVFQVFSGCGDIWDPWILGLNMLFQGIPVMQHSIPPSIGGYGEVAIRYHGM